MSDIGAMTETSAVAGYKLQMLVLERRNANRNMARFYVLAIEPTLFGETALVREWGRIGSWGRRRLDLHPNRAAAAESLDAWLVRKARRGYQVRTLTFSVLICVRLYAGNVQEPRAHSSQ